MATEVASQVATGIVLITTRGIQNLAALIPLLTTSLVEKHITKALSNGLLYAAAAPMSIFGSLGIAKAGCIALCASIDYHVFPGPALLKNAGFHPSGTGKLLLHMKHNKRHLYTAENNKRHLYKAEDKLRSVLNKKKVWEVEVNLGSRDFWSWNIRLALATMFLCTLGLLPYILVIQLCIEKPTFVTTWIFPILRLFGSGLVVVNLQFLFQLRLIEETYHRLRFIAADNYLKHIGKSIPANWDPNRRSKKVFDELQSAWLPLEGKEEGKEKSNTLRHQLDDDDKAKILDGVHKLTSFKFKVEPSPSTTPGPTPQTAHYNLGHRRYSSTGSRKDTVIFDEAEQGVPSEESEPTLDSAERVNTTASSMTKATTRAEKVALWVTRQFSTFLLWGTQLGLAFGILCVLVGYIGCFTVVQIVKPGWEGPLIWFVCEGLLAIFRTIIWAANPKWDDPKLPFVLEKIPNPTKPGAESVKAGLSQYGIGWALDSPTADDMHALIIGIDNCNTTDFEVLEKARSDAESVAEYLEDTLLVPRSQIRTLYDSDATRNKIVEELKSLRHRGTVTPDAPIIIYFAGHSLVSGVDGNTYLVPYLPPGDKILEGTPEEYCLPYSEVVDLLQHVADEKTDNIVVILDSCHAGAMGRSHFDTPSPRPPALTVTEGASPEEAVAGSPTELGSSLSRIHSGATTYINLPSTPAMPDEALASADAQIRRAGKKKSRQKISKATTEILIGHSCFLLLAGAAEEQEAFELPGKGGQFTQNLLAVLREAQEKGDLQTMTYEMLVRRIKEKFSANFVYGKKSLLEFQTALCTTIYQERYLFDGLFKRKVDNQSAKPVMRIRYSD